MRRAERLFHVVQLLRQRRTTTAARLAERLEVSERTVYRYIGDLVAAGVPIEGEAGVGYRLGKDFELPPLMLDVEETRALVLGARMVESWADPDLREASRRAIDKIRAVLPQSERKQLDDTALFSLAFGVSDELREAVGVIRRCIEGRTSVAIDYRDESGRATQREIVPLGLYFWGSRWTIAAWCTLRRDYRNFRVDRLIHATPGVADHPLPPGVDLANYVAAMEACDREAGDLDDHGE